MFLFVCASVCVCVCVCGCVCGCVFVCVCVCIILLSLFSRHCILLSKIVQKQYERFWFCRRKLNGINVLWGVNVQPLYLIPGEKQRYQVAFNGWENKDLTISFWFHCFLLPCRLAERKQLHWEKLILTFSNPDLNSLCKSNNRVALKSTFSK